MGHALVTIAVLASWVFAATGCGSDGVAEDDEESALETVAPALGKDDFKANLSKTFIAATHAMPAARFETKWQASVSGPALMFYRAYPGAYHADFARNLRESATGKLPSKAVGLCVGDAHPDNFGFLKFGQRVLYAFNDLDDSGYCPVVLDALRYVTAVRVFFDDEALTERAARRYVEVLTGERKESEARADIAKIRKDSPDFAERKADKLEELVNGGAIVRGAGLRDVPAQTRTTITAALRSVVEGTVLDAVFVEREAGGSGGLDRYWVLVQRGAGQTILELKERAKPGVEHGLDSRVIEESARLPLLKRAIWGVESNDDYVYTKAFGKTFLVRDRMAKASLDSLELKRGAREDLIDAQTSILGLLHKSTFAPSDDGAKAYRRWLEKSSSVMAERWATAFKAR